jgi:hypothetical protein
MSHNIPFLSLPSDKINKMRSADEKRRSHLQLATTDLVEIEQFGLGGFAVCAVIGRMPYSRIMATGFPPNCVDPD